MEKKQNTIWESFKKFVNSQPIGTKVTRQQIIQFIEKDTAMRCVGISTSYLRGKWNNEMFEVNPSFSPHTLDYQRNLAEKLGFLNKGVCCGEYVVVKHFSADYTVSQLRKDYDER